MLAVSETSAILKGAPGDEETWKELLCSLYTYARRLVRSASVESWQGQKEDLVEDIVQETVLRLLERVRRTGSGELPPIRSLKGFAIVVTRHYCIDLQRHDFRLRRATPNAGSGCGFEPVEQTNLFALVTERLSQEELFGHLAHCITHFPSKQREALLVDLAKRTHFEESSPLQTAFLAQGIDLQLYQRPLPTDPLERTRHTALLSLAYKRVARCMRAEVAG